MSFDSNTTVSNITSINRSVDQSFMNN
jgi:hypothetical protein